MGWFGGGRNDHKESARNAIVELRSQLLMLEKREDHIQKQIDEETRKAKANATSNPRCKSVLRAGTIVSVLGGLNRVEQLS